MSRDLEALEVAVHGQMVVRTTVVMVVLAVVVVIAPAVQGGAPALPVRSQLATQASTPAGVSVLGDPTGTSPAVHYVTWSNVNRWDVQIVAAAARFSVPPAYLKAIIAKESGGYWDDPKTGGIIQNPDSQATGLVQAMPDAGNEQLAQSLGLTAGYTDPAENIMLGAAILDEKHQVAVSLGDTGEAAWKAAAGGYFGVWPETMAETDATGTSGTQYVGDVLDLVDEIHAAHGGASAPSPQPPATPIGESLGSGSILDRWRNIAGPHRLWPSSLASG